MDINKSSNNKIKMMKKTFFVIVFFCTVAIYAQQEPQYTQYMYNTTIVNPAYAGSNGNIKLFGLYRAQWVGLEGAPTTANFSMHKPIEGTKMGFGVSVLNDKIGPSDETQLAVDLSYTLFLNKDNRLAFGVKTSGNILNIDYSKISEYNPGENMVNNNISNRFSPNLGLGLFYYNDNSYLGLSIPMILDAKRYDDVVSSSVNQRYHLYLMGGKVFDLNYDLKFKPAFVVKSTDGTPLQLDLTANMLYNNKFSFGMSYRWNIAVSAMAGFQINDNLFLGYGYDRETSRLTKIVSGSHELFLVFDIFRNKSRIDTPRYF